jgi:MerR family transcriptional regulator, Zn(II)-responsive regulator of zntA
VTRHSSTARTFRSGELARLAGVSTDTLRHYERKGLIAAPRRLENGYREYPAATLDRVRLVRSALAVGFTLDELAEILAVRDRGGAPCRRARALLETKLADVEARLRELEALRETLSGALGEWDARLREAPEGAQARLLESLREPAERPAASARSSSTDQRRRFKR